MSAGWKVAVASAAVLLLAALLGGTFAMGTRLGEMRARAVGPRSALMAPMLRAFIADHGAYGRVEQVDVQARTIAVHNKAGTSTVVLVSDDTLLERHGQAIDVTTLEPGEWIVAIGAPDEEGHLVARAVRSLGVRGDGPVPVWSGMVKGICRIYQSVDATLHRLFWRRGS